jgi:hypothetical protein
MLGLLFQVNDAKNSQRFDKTSHPW